MKKTHKHTSGEWEVKHAHTDFIVSPSGVIAFTAWVNNSKAEGDANALLLAGAPKLLKACEDALSTLKQMTTHEFQRGGDKAIIAQMEAAVLKATEEK